MITKIKVEYATYLTEKLGTGPLETVVYTGSYGPDKSCVLGCTNTNTESAKNKPKTVRVKKIEMKIVKNDIDWEVLQLLEHPCVARYILVYDKHKTFQPDAVYIIQDYCQFTLSTFIENIDQINNGTVLKTAVQQIASGLNYLHGKGIVHRNLKPSNVLVKPPLSQPEGYVLTDYAYTDCRSYPQQNFCCCFPPEQVPDHPEITKWMAPELLQESPDDVWTNRTPGGDDSDCSILDLDLQERRNNRFVDSTISQFSSMVDIFSFGKVLESMFEKVGSLDEVDRILCKLLVEQMTTSTPSHRISCNDILKSHPFLIVQLKNKSKGIAEARSDYIKELYDRIKEKGTLRQQIEKAVNPVTGKFFPWSEPSHSFGSRIFVEMNKRPQIKKKYDSNSFMDLLRLIRNTKEHPLEDKKFKRIRDEVSDDAFNLGQFENIANGASISDGKLNNMVDKLIDDQFQTSHSFIETDPITLTIALPSSTSGEDSYGVSKIMLYSLQAAHVTGWKIYFKSLPRAGVEWPCSQDEATGEATPTTGVESETWETYFEAIVECGPNTQTKIITLKIGAPGAGLRLNEIIVAGLQSSKYACDKGWNPGTQTCTRCQPGKKGVQEEDKEPICEDCPAGQFSKFLDDFEPILECISCSPGTYSQIGSASCTECPQGSFQDQAAQSECTKCPSGEFQNLKAKTFCTKCAEGFFSPEGSSACVACPAGSVAETEGATECIKCPVGTHQSDKGQSRCQECKAGYYADEEGSEKCIPCKKGFYNAATAGSECTECEAGTYQSDEGKTICIDCNMGTYNGQTGQASCIPSSVGKFVDTKKATEFKICAAGSYQDVPGSIDCKQCKPLQYQAQPGASQCLTCEQGTMSEAGALECVPCEAGTYLEPLTRTCIECDAGSYSQEKSLFCTLCDIMQYQDQKKQGSCMKCPTGSTTLSKGSTSCLPCDRGYFRADDATENTCSQCLPGTYSDETGAEACKQCPEGTFSGSQAIQCEKCTKGTFQNEPGKMNCEECAAGSFSDEEGQTTCTPCKLDSVTAEKGSFSCMSCSYGFYSPEVGGMECLICPLRASYQPPSCPPVIPNCPKISISNQYGNYNTTSDVEPIVGKGIPQTFECQFGLWSEAEDGSDTETKNTFTTECLTWNEGDLRKSGWSTPSYSKCGTLQTRAIYDQTKAARKAIEEAEASGGGLEEATVPPDQAQGMLTSLMGALESPSEENGGGTGEDGTVDDGTEEGSTSGNDGGEEKEENNSLGASDTASVVKTLAVVANSVPAAVLADPVNQKNILGAINDFAGKDDDFVQDAGTDTASAAVNVVESIGASMFSVPTTTENPTDNQTENINPTSGKTEQSKRKEAAKNDIKTDTMTIRPTLLTEETRTKSIDLDFGDDEEDEEITEESNMNPTDAPIIPVLNYGDDPAPTDAPVLQMVRATKPPPVKKTVKVQMPPLNNLIKASGDEEAMGLVCVVFESSSLFPTEKKDTDPSATVKTTSEVASKVVLLSFGSHSVKGIDPPLALNFSKEEPPEDFDSSTQSVGYKCVYYKKETKSWESDGCETKAVGESRGGKVECVCDHMTSFAILMSMEPIPDYLEEIQSAITNPLIGFSLFCLLFMVVTVMPFKALRSTRSMKIHLSLAGSQCFAIACFLLTNIPDETKKSVPVLCKAIAVLVDYAYLVVFMWTVVESVIMYISLVQVFGGHISMYMLKFNLFCWLTPLLNPLTSYFLTEGILLDKGQCMVALSVRMWSFILPVGVVLLINFFIFVSLIKVIANATNPEKSATENAMKQLKAVASISVLLGLGWIISFFGRGPMAPFIQFAFIIINGSQGIFMFLFYCVGNEQYINCWKTKFGMEVIKPGGTMSTVSSTAKAPQARCPTAAQPTSSTTASPPAAQPAVQAASPPPKKPAGGGATSRPNRRGARQTKEPEVSEKDKGVEKEMETEEESSAIYENENVYDIIDDPDIKAITAATITRI